MRKRIMGLTLVLMLTVVVVLSGCTSKKEPKEALQAAAANAMKMDTYVVDNQFMIKDFTTNMGQGQEQVGQVVQMLKNAEFNVHSVYQKAPMQTESTLEIKLKGDVATTITIPFVMTPEKIYVKIPSVPFLPLPKESINKFLVLDLKELAKESGTELKADMFNPEKTQKLGSEISNAVFAEYDSAKYFKNLDKKDIALPKDYSEKQIVQFYITNENVKEAVTTFVNKALPKILDIISKDEYRDMLQLSKEDIDKAKKDIMSGNQDELNKAINEMKNNLKINQFTVNTAIDKNDYPSYQNLNANVEISDPSTKQDVKLNVEGNTTYTKINEKQKFDIGIPTNTITLEQLQQQMGAASGLQ
ncbi:D-Tyr-tRNAtyr deacylase [Paenibacillus shirakamiensis]|uniref:D-Tyr-tRNAtyr deacylase n=1 Tax=Paenibacillus shirakamiensis TaxID=1265935 RepID=A0ABS4JM36_9BACL|nr:DUF6612 family protein [Paenibacillus shirakamiensis]MBP2002778.1 D-Tyr-tRNAtyr deacylase [Paenibacillus shirakamiensis]